jgi:hypothetical protein
VDVIGELEHHGLGTGVDDFHAELGDGVQLEIANEPVEDVDVISDVALRLDHRAVTVASTCVLGEVAEGLPRAAIRAGLP